MEFGEERIKIESDSVDDGLEHCGLLQLCLEIVFAEHFVDGVYVVVEPFLLDAHVVSKRTTLPEFFITDVYQLALLCHAKLKEENNRRKRPIELFWN